MMDDEGKWASAYTLTRPEEKEQMCPVVNFCALFKHLQKIPNNLFEKKEMGKIYFDTINCRNDQYLAAILINVPRMFFNYREECLTKLTGQVEHCFAFVYA